MKRFFLVLAFLSMFWTSQGQSELAGEPTLRLTKPTTVRYIFKFDGRLSELYNNSVRVLGFKTGLEFNKRHEFGIGYHWARTNVDLSVPGSDANQPNANLRGRVQFNYWEFYYEWDFFHHDKWILSSPVAFGGGIVQVTYRTPSGTVIPFQRNKYAWLLEPSFMAEYKVFRYAGLAAGVGYRYMFPLNEAERGLVNSPIGIAKVKIYLGQIYRDVKYGRPKAEEEY